MLRLFIVRAQAYLNLVEDDESIKRLINKSEKCPRRELKSNQWELRCGALKRILGKSLCLGISDEWSWCEVQCARRVWSALGPLLKSPNFGVVFRRFLVLISDMRRTVLLIFVVCFGLSSARLDVLYKWRTMDFEYPNQAARDSHIRNGDFIPGTNSMPLDVDISYQGVTQVHFLVKSFSSS